MLETLIHIAGRRYWDLQTLLHCSKRECGQIVIPVGGQLRRPLKQSFPANTLTLKFQTSRKLGLWSIPSSGITWSYQNHDSRDVWCMREHIMNQRRDTCAGLMGADKLDVNLRDKFWFFSSFLIWLLHSKTVLHAFSETSSCVCVWDIPSCQLATADLMCLCLLCRSGGDWNSLCGMIFEVIKESHSVELTVLMESRNHSSGPTAAGGVQKCSAVGRSAGRDVVCYLVLRDALYLLLWNEEGNMMVFFPFFCGLYCFFCLLSCVWLGAKSWLRKMNYWWIYLQKKLLLLLITT